jgi:hypothetical protein
LLLIAGSTLAQSSAGKKADKPGVAPEAVAPDDMVIMITGACQTPPGEFAVRDCIRGMSRQEFEALVAATNPNATPEYRQQLAEKLGRVIILSNEAKKRGLPKDPKVKELLRMLQLQELANLVVAGTDKEDAAKASDTEIEEFYRSHQNDLQVAELLRLTVPRKTSNEFAAEDRTYAESVRSRCGAGEDPAKLQAEAWQRVNQNAAPPEVLKNQRRAQYPEAQKSVFDLKPGECAPFSPNKTKFEIYKMVAMTVIPLSDARSAIVEALQSERARRQIGELTKQYSIQLNSKYFPVMPAVPATQTAPGASPK